MRARRLPARWPAIAGVRVHAQSAPVERRLSDDRFSIRNRQPDLGASTLLLLQSASGWMGHGEEEGWRRNDVECAAAVWRWGPR